MLLSFFMFLIFDFLRQTNLRDSWTQSGLFYGDSLFFLFLKWGHKSNQVKEKLQPHLGLIKHKSLCTTISTQVTNMVLVDDLSIVLFKVFVS
jgi:hypothetical protein